MPRALKIFVFRPLFSVSGVRAVFCREKTTVGQIGRNYFCRFTNTSIPYYLLPLDIVYGTNFLYGTHVFRMTLVYILDLLVFSKTKRLLSIGVCELCLLVRLFLLKQRGCEYLYWYFYKTHIFQYLYWFGRNFNTFIFCTVVRKIIKNNLGRMELINVNYLQMKINKLKTFKAKLTHNKSNKNG